MRKGCRSGCDRCPPCPSPKPTPAPTTLTLTSNGSEMTFSLGAGLTGYVATGVLLASWLGLWLAAKAGWVEVRATKPPTWCPFSPPSGGEGRGPSAAATASTPAVDSATASTPAVDSATQTTLGLFQPTAPLPSLPSGPPSYTFYSAGEGESLYSEPASLV